VHANVQKIQFGGTYNPAQVSVFNTAGIRNTLLFLLYYTVRYGFPPDCHRANNQQERDAMHRAEMCCVFCCNGVACEFLGFST
jgi:hypothetical protein